jgi:hypothetical protein
MDRTEFRDLKQSASLGIIQVALKFNFAIDAVEQTLLRVTVHAILGVNPKMLKPHNHAS